ncbi:hypothetical protein M413DRAFT_439299 [Hebeloma cylindrosporum]|uniref:Uncharacterized protein n=1 Tax=Hebeloma cylindrosporum TaxID=76867 RepID=A0A0C2YCW3_HEBCY|nr:hypothetical protein M413DRAFT_439299 [Hebeloma cylindrosporum h7]
MVDHNAIGAIRQMQDIIGPTESRVSTLEEHGRNPLVPETNVAKSAMEISTHRKSELVSKDLEIRSAGNKSNVESSLELSKCSVEVSIP